MAETGDAYAHVGIVNYANKHPIKSGQHYP